MGLDFLSSIENPTYSTTYMYVPHTVVYSTILQYCKPGSLRPRWRATDGPMLSMQKASATRTAGPASCSSTNRALVDEDICLLIIAVIALLLLYLPKGGDNTPTVQHCESQVVVL